MQVLADFSFEFYMAPQLMRGHGCMVAFFLSVKTFWKNPHRNTQSCAAQVILNPAKLTMRVNYTCGRGHDDFGGMWGGERTAV